MDRRLARKNLTVGLILAGAVVAIFGLTFLIAALYLS
jgi:hypothetical protein